VFLPDQQPQFQVEDGKVISNNRWFRAPVETLKLNHNNSEIYYDIRIPGAEEVIFQDSYAAHMWLGDPDRGFFLRASAADKPQNQFHLLIDSNEAMSLLGVGGGMAQFVTKETVYPIVVRHRIYSTEFGHKWDGSKITVSVATEQFEKPEVAENWLQTELVDSRYYGAIYDQSLSIFGWKRTYATLSYVEKDRALDKSTATIIQGDIESSMQRFQFDKMASVEVRKNFLQSRRRKLDVRTRYIYSIGDKGEWFSAGLRWKEGDNWIWDLSGDVLGVSEDTRTNTSFISAYRGNDRLSGSLTYVF